MRTLLFREGKNGSPADVPKALNDTHSSTVSGLGTWVYLDDDKVPKGLSKEALEEAEAEAEEQMHSK